MKSERPAFDLFLLVFSPLSPHPSPTPTPSSSAIFPQRGRHSFQTVPCSLATQNNYQALLHQIMVDTGGHDGEGQRSAGVALRLGPAPNSSQRHAP